jgi:hypothetical protein
VTAAATRTEGWRAVSIIYYYARVDANCARTLAEDDIFGDAASKPEGMEVIDIDKAHEALAWLASPTKRAEVAHRQRLIRDPNWALTEARANVARLNAMPQDDPLVALQGSASYTIERPELPFLATMLFPPERVRSLSASLGRLTEPSLREHLDFRVMEEDDVVPGYWGSEGEETFNDYLMPALKRLQRFYEAAAERGQAILLLVQ